MTIKQAKVQHVVAIPYPAQGHINPMLQLCQQLVPRGFTFTFINTQHIHHRLQHAAHVPQEDDHAPDAHHGQDAHTHAPEGPHDEDAHVPPAHLDKDAQIHIAQTNNDAHTHHHGEGARSHGHDAHHGEDARANGVHHYKGCSSIHMVSVAGGCAPEQHAHISGLLEAFKAAQEMQEAVEHLLSDIMKDQGVAFILSDLMLVWSSATAHKFGLPWVGFWPASVATCSAFIHFSGLADLDKRIPIAEMEAGEALIEGIPGLPPTHLHDVPKVWDDTGRLHHVVLKCFTGVLEQASFLLFNTFAELEGRVLQTLSKRFPVLAVGPLLPSPYMRGLHTCPDSREEHFRRLSLFQEDRACLEWLNKQAPSSVLFISFGSISLRSEVQLRELAKGVEASGCPFLWVRRPTNHSPDSSAGFTHDRMYENGAMDGGHGQQNGFALEGGHPQGIIVPWAPQLQVLSHPAVGGFITHCGWNSVMESVSMGVPMLCWADTGERMSNQRFVVEFWKCGVDMVADSRRATQHFDEGGLVRRDEVEKSVRFLMFEEAGASIRAQAGHLRNGALTAFQDSHTHLNVFAQAMQQKLNNASLV